MAHRNAPLSVAGRRRLVQRCQDRPIAHVAAEMLTPVSRVYPQTEQVAKDAAGCSAERGHALW
ncbi:hypothetical protein GCM10009727_43330 [Actinomadura napierensis]|uniref:Uncharacterized protein n=1 Tax=Actinomadura napierensis TaxID=267854 RepID=A0ABN2ZL89_9ACTN